RRAARSTSRSSSAATRRAVSRATRRWLPRKRAAPWPRQPPITLPASCWSFAPARSGRGAIYTERTTIMAIAEAPAAQRQAELLDIASHTLAGGGLGLFQLPPE